MIWKGGLGDKSIHVPGEEGAGGQISEILKQRKMYPERGRPKRANPWGIGRAWVPDFSLGMTSKKGRGWGEGLKSLTRTG